MSSEPQRPIEKLLRDSAQKRREQAGAPFELHPVTRKLLQGEVARQFSRGTQRSESDGFWLKLGRFWPRIAWSLGSLAIVAFSAWLLFPHGPKWERETLLSNQEGMRQGEPGPANVASGSSPAKEVDLQKQSLAKVPAETPSVTRDKSALTESAVSLADSEKRAAVKPGAVSSLATPTVAETSAALADKDAKDSNKALFADSASRQKALSDQSAGAAAQPSAAPAAVASTGVTGGNETASSFNRPVATAAEKADSRMALAATPPVQGSAPSTQSQAGALANEVLQPPSLSSNFLQVVELAQNFRRLDTAARDQSKAYDDLSKVGIVLAEFRIKQSGQDVQVIDRDGSVYIGHILMPGNSMKSSLVARRTQSTPSSRSYTALSNALSDGRLTGSNDNPLQTLAFQVSGTNVSVNQQVVFSGFLTWTGPTNVNFNSVMRSGNEAIGGFAGGGGASSNLSRTFPGDSHVSGKFSVGGAKEFDLEAVPAKP